MENVENQALSKGLSARPCNEMQNDAGTTAPIDARLTHARSLSVPDIRRHLLQHRFKANPEARPYISNLIGQTGHWEQAEPTFRTSLAAGIETSIQRIEAARQGE